MARRKRAKAQVAESGAHKPFDETKHRRAAGGRFGIKGSTSAPAAQRASSTVDSPVRRMHALAEKMHGKPRADILAAAQAIGINRSTASTQLYVYQRNRAARELQAAATSATAGAAAKPREVLQAAAARALGVAPARRSPAPAPTPKPKDAPTLDPGYHTGTDGKLYFASRRGRVFDTGKDGQQSIPVTGPVRSARYHGDNLSVGESLAAHRAHLAGQNKPPAKPAANRFAMQPGERPVAAFHRIANEMHDRPRSEVIATAVSAGVNRSTASVQYSQWARNRAATRPAAATTPVAAPAPATTARRPMTREERARDVDQRIERERTAAQVRLDAANRLPDKTKVSKAAAQAPGERKLIKDTTEGVPARGTPEREMHDKLLRASSVFEGSTFYAHYRGGKITGFSISGRDVQISRRFTGDTVDHSYFELGNDQRGSGAAKTFLRETVAAYKKAGYKKVEVHANIDVGGYAWLRYGFEPKAGHSHAMLRSAVDHRLNSPGVHEALTDAQQTQVLSLANQGKFYEVANMTTPIKQQDGTFRPLGRHLFMNSDWHGTLDLNNKRNMDIFERYAGDKK